jgi:hypothetical protein
VLGHGLRLALTVNQSARVSVQITIPHASKRRTKATMLLLRFSRTLGAGSTQVTLKLSRAAAGRLVAAGLPVLTVRVTLTGAAGSSQTRTIKIRLTR